MGYPKKRPAFLVSDKRKQGYGGNRTAKTKKAERLQVYLLTLDIVGTHVPCLVYAGVYACPGLSLPCPGDIQERGRGLIGLVCEKRPQNINAWTCIGVALSAQGKRQRVRAKVADGGNPIEHDQGKSFL